MKILEEEFTFLKNKLEKSGENIKVKIISDSMEPLIMVNEDIVIEFVDYDELRYLDIIVFWKDNKLLCHCLWSKDLNYKDCFITKSYKYRQEFDFKTDKRHYLGKVNDKKLSFFNKIKMVLSKKV